MLIRLLSLLAVCDSLPLMLYTQLGKSVLYVF